MIVAFSVAIFSFNLYIYLLKFLHCIMVVLCGNELKSVRIATDTLTLWTITEAFSPPSSPPSIAIPPLIYFFQTSTPYQWQDFYDNIALLIYGLNTKINSSGKVVSSCLEDYKTMTYSLYISNTFICHTRLRCNFKCISYKDLKEKNLLSKEHYYYKIGISLMKNIEIPHF